MQNAEDHYINLKLQWQNRLEQDIQQIRQIAQAIHQQTQEPEEEILTRLLTDVAKVTRISFGKILGQEKTSTIFDAFKKTNS